MNLARIQFYSLVTKAVTTGLGIIQSFVVIRLLSPAEFGLVGLVMSIGGVIGVSQHLGIVDGAIREIAIHKNKREVAKVFWVSHAARQLVTIPLSLALIGAAGFIASRLYQRPEITLLIQVFAAILILQGLQDVLGATLTGLKKFKALYAVQIITAAVNVVVFGLLTYRFAIYGFFMAIIFTTSLMICLLAWAVVRDLRSYLTLPTWHDFQTYGRNIMRIGAYMYVARIFFVVWQRLPILLLGGILTADQLGYLNVSLAFGARLTIVAAALSEVNLSWMSSLFASQRNEFVRTVTTNLHRVLVLMMSMTFGLLYFTPEIIKIIGREYVPAEPLIMVMTLAFFLYALIDIGTSSVFVPANKPRTRALIYGLMAGITGVTIAVLLRWQPHPLTAAYAVLGGAVVAYIVMVTVVRRQFHIMLVTRELLLAFAALAASFMWLLTNPALGWRLSAFVVLMLYIARESLRQGWFSKQPSTTESGALRIVCFAGAPFSQLAWTNRQQIMSRVSAQHYVLFIEPRTWIVRELIKNWQSPKHLISFLRRLLWYEKQSDKLFVKAQWNLIPGSREVFAIAKINHWLNRYGVLLCGNLLGFNEPNVLWIYDTEAAEYISAYPNAIVMYDCVDDHAAQAGHDRNSERVTWEEKKIVARADLITVTSHELLKQKKRLHPNVHLVLNAGDVRLFSTQPTGEPERIMNIPHPRLGLVGALDSYKVDFAMLAAAAKARPLWHFVLLGEPLVEHTFAALTELSSLPNVHRLGPVDRTDVPPFVHAFDVCLIPYQASRYNAASFPLKFWEYMATGKPIVAAGVPELKAYVPRISYVAAVQEFIAAIEGWLAAPHTFSEQRIALARDNSWEMRTEKLLSLVTSAVSARATKKAHAIVR